MGAAEVEELKRSSQVENEKKEEVNQDISLQEEAIEENTQDSSSTAEDTTEEQVEMKDEEVTPSTNNEGVSNGQSEKVSEEETTEADVPKEEQPKKEQETGVDQLPKGEKPAKDTSEIEQREKQPQKQQPLQIEGESEGQSPTEEQLVQEDQPRAKKNEDSAVKEVKTSPPYQKGDHSKEIAKFKKKLNAIGFGQIRVTEYFGSYTENRVKKFQKYYSIPVSGVVDQQTLNKIERVYSSPFQKGKQHKQTRNIKKKLNRLSYGSIYVTNYYGGYTDKVVRQFQRKNNLVVNGVVDSVTKEKLDKEFRATFQMGGRHEGIPKMKRNLKRLGFGGMRITNYYGSYTAKKVKDFQRYYGLNVTGKATMATQDKMYEVLTSNIQEGKRHKIIPTMKKKMNWLGYSYISETNYFGSYTNKMLKKFQRDHQLPVSGIAEENTLNKLDKVFNNTFQPGSRHDSVVTLKKELRKVGFGGMRVTSYYGNYTKKRVKDFQRYYGLNVTGEANYSTLSKLDNILNNPFQKGKRSKKTVSLKKKLNRIGFGYIQETSYYGSYSEKRVKELQSYYGLYVNGIVDEPTLNQINKVANSPFQKGKRHKNTVTLKKYLNNLGYGNIRVTSYFGSYTEKQLKRFQRDYKLPVNGIADQKTWSILQREAAKVKEKVTYTRYNKTLNQAVNDQMERSPQTDKYRNAPAYVYAKYVNITESGVITENGVRLRTKPNWNGKVNATVYSGTKVTILDTVNGAEYAGSKKWYKIKYKGDTLYVHYSLANPKGRVATTTVNLNVRAEASSSSHIYGTVPKGTSLNVTDKGKYWHQISYSTWRNAKRSDVKYYMNPDNNDKFQHLLLTESVGVSARELNKVLDGKGVLEGKGQAFIDAGKKHSVNEAYLISHAILETGHGASSLANGSTKVGLNNHGKPEVVNSHNRDELTNIKPVYNMFGIQAYDSCPLTCGAKHAYNQGWTTPDKAIVGGAKFIGEDYIHNAYEQNTIYKMRWNINTPWKQYATDIGWAAKQVYGIKNIYSKLNNPMMHYNIPKFI